MDSRSAILNKVIKNKPSIEAKIEMSQFYISEGKDIVESFCSNLEANDGNCLILDTIDNLHDVLLKEVKGRSFVDLSETIKFQQGFGINKPCHPKALAHIQVLIIPGKIGVAENGAVWVDDEVMQHIRVLPFIVERTVFILNKSQIVPTMHHAYQTLGKVKTGFGTFIAGPSKTGDIEQNLVIGAHGALSHLVILVSPRGYEVRQLL